MMFRWVLIMIISLTMVPEASANTAIPEVIRERADEFIISQVGQDYFLEKYRYVPDRSRAKAYAHGVRYVLSYEYISLSQLTGKQQIVEVRVYSDPDVPTSNYVASVRDGDVFEPKVKLDEAISISDRHITEIFDKGHIKARISAPSDPMEHWMWVLKIPVEEFNRSCRTSYIVWIDAVNAAFHSQGKSQYCK